MSLIEAHMQQSVWTIPPCVSTKKNASLAPRGCQIFSEKYSLNLWPVALSIIMPKIWLLGLTCIKAVPGLPFVSAAMFGATISSPMILWIREEVGLKL